MSSSRNLEEVAEQALKEKAEMEARVKYLQDQLGQLLREKQRNWQASPPSSDASETEEASNSEDNPFGFPSESSRGTRRTTRRSREVHHDFKVDIPEFKGKLDP